MAREAPRAALTFAVRAFGGEVGWPGDSSPYPELDARITHHVVDRPKPTCARADRAFVQPQWVFDCINFKVLLPPAMYAPGRPPPPHLSPFVDPEEDGYTPDFAKVVEKLKRAAERSVVGGSAPADPEPDAGAFVKATREEEEAEAAAQYQAELRAELDGKPLEEVEAEGAKAAAAKQSRRGKGKRKATEAEEEAQLADMMLSRKQRRLYQGVKRGQERKAAEVERLEQKKQAAAAAAAPAATRKARKKPPARSPKTRAEKKARATQQ